MAQLPTHIENPDGLHQRYNVSKTNGEPVDANAEYFVLRLDDEGDDNKHIKACRIGVLAYANAIKEHLPKLSEDIINRYGNKQC